MNKISGLAILLSLLISGTALWFSFQTRPKTAYVDLAKVYQDFLLKKEFEQQLMSVDQSAQYLLDSLQSQLTAMSRDFEANKSKQIFEDYQIKQREYSLAQQRAAEEREALALDFDNKIWTQLNQYVDDYAKKENYDYILGANGSGSIMGGKPEYDLTNTITKYINQRYNGSME